MRNLVSTGDSQSMRVESLERDGASPCLGSGYGHEPGRIERAAYYATTLSPLETAINRKRFVRESPWLPFGRGAKNGPD